MAEKIAVRKVHDIIISNLRSMDDEKKKQLLMNITDRKQLNLFKWFSFQDVEIQNDIVYLNSFLIYDFDSIKEASGNDIKKIIPVKVLALVIDLYKKLHTKKSLYSHEPAVKMQKKEKLISDHLDIIKGLMLEIQTNGKLYWNELLPRFLESVGKEKLKKYGLKTTLNHPEKIISEGYFANMVKRHMKLSGDREAQNYRFISKKEIMDQVMKENSEEENYDGFVDKYLEETTEEQKKFKQMLHTDNAIKNKTS